MTSYASIINDLEDAIASGVSERRVETLTRIADLFIHGGGNYTQEQVALFDDVIGRLAAEIEVKARAKLACRLAVVPNAPPKVMRSLAFDDAIEVAYPVLSQSKALDDRDLVATANSKSQGHLMAISQREALSETVTDVLVRRGDRHVVHSVAKNTGARFSNAGFRMLVKRSTTDETLAEHVGLREDIPRHHFLKLVEQASESVRQKLLAANPQASDEVQQVINEVVDHIRSDVQSATRDYANAEALIASRHGLLDENDIYGFAKYKKYEETVAALARMSGVSIDIAERAMVEDGADLILILAKAADLSWTTVKMILLMRAQGSVSVQDLERALKGFEKLQVATAQRVLEFYRTRETGRP